MKTFSLFIIEIIISALFVWLGLGHHHILWINSPRAAAITLSAIGFVLCMNSIGKFINAAPAHPLTVCSYLVGVILLVTMITQIFTLKLPIVKDQATALTIIGVCIVLKGFIAQFQSVVVK